ncbi:MAG: hypothetical protein KKF56_00605 [Nanoarchaeota archaeon]|nr:hypothetical protein [Nanoarchaeota archaeon]
MPADDGYDFENVKARLQRYRHGALAQITMNDQSRRGVAVDAMDEFYFGENSNDADDPVLNDALSSARRGLSAGHLAHEGILKAISLYSGKFDDAFDGSRTADFVDFSGLSLSDEAKEILKPYEGMYISDLRDVAKAEAADKYSNRDAIRALSLVGTAQKHYIEAVAYPEALARGEQRTIESIVNEHNQIHPTAPATP